jgi:hypothetical protein
MTLMAKSSQIHYFYLFLWPLLAIFNSKLLVYQAGFFPTDEHQPNGIPQWSRRSWPKSPSPGAAQKKTMASFKETRKDIENTMKIP